MANNITHAAQPAHRADVRLFTFHLPSGTAFDVRTIVIDIEPWFVAKDVATALGYTNPQKACRDHCKSMRQVGVNDSFTPLDPQTSIIPERDLYRLVMRSKLESAHEFEEWVVGDVLPSLRKTGSYAMQPAAQAIDFMNPHSLRAALLGYTEQLIAMEATVQSQAPAVAAQKRLGSADGSMCVTNAAKQLKMRPKDLFAWLSANKWIYKRAGSSVWLGYQERIQAGLVEHSTTTVERSDGSEKAVDNMRLTAKGLAKLAEALGTEVVA
jgi:prophage antirepressor-like protein